MRLLLALVLLVSACSRRTGPRPGDLDVVWRGADRGRFIAPFTATFCLQTGIVELLAVRGDTGVGAALFLPDSARVQATAYTVVPGSQLDEPRPGATVAVRWFATPSLSSFEGVTGTVRLDSVGTTISGTLDVGLRGLDRPDTLRATGRFTSVPLGRGDSTCGRTSRRNKR